MMRKAQVTAVVNAHREGLIAQPSLLSVSRAKSHAKQNGFEVETIVVLDQADSLTSEVIERWATTETDIQVVHVNNEDLGISRNDAVSKASGEWIAFLDADDLWCETWLTNALNSAEGNRPEVVWHPEINVYFGTRTFLFRHIDMESSEFEPSSLLISNHWTALCMARRELLLKVPYFKADLQNKIGYEDWSWNLAVIERGAIHKIVRGTGHAIRTKTNSLNTETQRAGAIPNPNRRMAKLLWSTPSAFRG